MGRCGRPLGAAALDDAGGAGRRCAAGAALPVALAGSVHGGVDAASGAALVGAAGVRRRDRVVSRPQGRGDRAALRRREPGLGAGRARRRAGLRPAARRARCVRRDAGAGGAGRAAAAGRGMAGAGAARRRVRAAGVGGAGRSARRGGRCTVGNRCAAGGAARPLHLREPLAAAHPAGGAAGGDAARRSRADDAALLRGARRRRRLLSAARGVGGADGADTLRSHRQGLRPHGRRASAALVGARVRRALEPLRAGTATDARNYHLRDSHLPDAARVGRRAAGALHHCARAQPRPRDGGRDRARRAGARHRARLPDDGLVPRQRHG